VSQKKHFYSRLDEFADHAAMPGANIDTAEYAVYWKDRRYEYTVDDIREWGAAREAMRKVRRRLLPGSRGGERSTCSWPGGPAALAAFYGSTSCRVTGERSELQEPSSAAR